MLYYASKERISVTAGTIDEESVRGTLPKVSEHIFVRKGVDRFERHDLWG